MSSIYELLDNPGRIVIVQRPGEEWKAQVLTPQEYVDSHGESNKLMRQYWLDCNCVPCLWLEGPAQPTVGAFDAPSFLRFGDGFCAECELEVGAEIHYLCENCRSS